MTTLYRLSKNLGNRWIIVNAQDPQLAWSGSRWVEHVGGIPAGRAQVSNFASKQEAHLHAGECGMVEDASARPEITLELTHPQFIALRSLVMDLLVGAKKMEYQGPIEWFIIGPEGETTITLEDLYVLLTSV